MRKICLLFLIIFALFGCKKKTYKNIDIEVKLYFAFFNNNSYWVFIDTINNVKDSLYITNYSRVMQSPRGSKTKTYKECINYEYTNNSPQLNVNINETSEDYSVIEFLTTTPSIFNINTSICYSANFYSNISTTNINYYSSYNAINKSYNDVLMLTTNDDTLYFAKNIGLIKYKNKINNHYYYLNNYQIIN